MTISSAVTTLGDTTLGCHQVHGDSIREFPRAVRPGKQLTRKTFIVAVGFPYVSYPCEAGQPGYLSFLRSVVMPYLSIPGYQGEVRKRAKRATEEVAVSSVVRDNSARVESLGDAILEYHQVRGFHT